MKLELTKIKYSEFASQETRCFEAVLVVDGVPSMRVRNDGHGGCDMQEALKITPAGHDLFESAMKRIKEYAATLPRVPFGKSCGYDGDYAPDIESLVGDLLTDYLIAKDYRRAAGRKVLFTRKDKPGVFEISVKKMTNGRETLVTPDVIARVQKFAHVAVIMNSLPESEAIRLYQTEGAKG